MTFSTPATPSAHVQIALEGVARGITVADTLGRHGAPEPNCSIARAVDAPAFLDYFVSTIASR